MLFLIAKDIKIYNTILILQKEFSFNKDPWVTYLYIREQRIKYFKVLIETKRIHKEKQIISIQNRFMSLLREIIEMLKDNVKSPA